MDIGLAADRAASLEKLVRDVTALLSRNPRDRKPNGTFVAGH